MSIIDGNWKSVMFVHFLALKVHRGGQGVKPVGCSRGISLYVLFLGSAGKKCFDFASLCLT